MFSQVARGKKGWVTVLAAVSNYRISRFFGNYSPVSLDDDSNFVPK